MLREFLLWSFSLAAVVLLFFAVIAIVAVSMIGILREVRRFKQEDRSGRIADSIEVEFDSPTELCAMPNEQSQTRFSTTQRQKIAPRFLDRRGNDAPIDGSPSVVSADPTIVEVEQTEGGYWLKAKAVGQTTVTISADARIGDGNVPITETITVEIIPDEAIDVDPNFGAPEDQPA